MILGHALAVAVNRYDYLYKSMRPPLSLMQLIILQSIVDGQTMHEADIAGNVGLEKESVRLILHRILKRKFFEKRGKGKVKALYLTKTGKDAIQKSATLAARAQMHMLEALPLTQRELFQRALSTLTVYPYRSL